LTRPLAKVFWQIRPDLTNGGGCVFFSLLQPKSGFLPEAGCGGTKLLKQFEDGANGAR
jgi:hypothetical protein